MREKNKNFAPKKQFDTPPKNRKFEKNLSPLDSPPVTTKSLTVAKKISSETKIYGVNACQAAFARRPQDIVRVYIEANRIKSFSKLLKVCADKKIAYKIITQEELNKVTNTTHNEGICLLIKKKEVFNFKKFLSQASEANKPCCVVALDNVQNPHNVGAILRVCANFSVDAMLLQEPQLAQSGAVYRTAEGGAEWVQILETGELLKALEEFKRQGFKVYGTSSHSGQALQKSSFSLKSVILFDSEAEGLSTTLLKMCDMTLFIPQSGNVESLNVSCAASVILYQNYIQRST